MKQAGKTFGTDAFIERACVLILLLLTAVTIIACIGLHKIYGIYNEVKLIAIPVFGVFFYLILSVVNKSLGISKYIRSTIPGTTNISNHSLNRMIRAIKLSILITITFSTIETQQRANNIHTDMQGLSSVSEIVLVMIPIMYILLQLYRTRTSE